ncbi:unnamed protein product [Rhodiola kirilowii]
MGTYCAKHGIAHQFASAITPQQNGVVEWKNRTIIEMARVMIHAKKIPLKFWSEAMNTAVSDDTDDSTSTVPETQPSQQTVHKPTEDTSDNFPKNSSSDETDTVNTQENVITLQPSRRIARDQPISEVIGSPSEGVQTRRKLSNSRELAACSCFLSLIEPKNIKEALLDEYWVLAMQEEQEEFA